MYNHHKAIVFYKLKIFLVIFCLKKKKNTTLRYLNFIMHFIETQCFRLYFDKLQVWYIQFRLKIFLHESSVLECMTLV